MIGLNTDKPFEKRLRRLELRPAVRDPEEMAEAVIRCGADCHVSSAMLAHTGRALYRSELFPLHEGMADDALRRMIEIEHAADVMVISWYCPKVNLVAAERYPEWRMKPEPAGEPPCMCFLSSPYRQFLHKHIGEIMDRVPFDGFWFDGCDLLAGGARSPFGACRCAHCRRSFEQDTGLALPESVDWLDPRFKAYVRWRYNKYLGWQEELTEFIRSRKPDAVVAFNVVNRPEWCDTDEGGEHIRDFTFDWKVGQPWARSRAGWTCGSESVSSIWRLQSARLNAKIAKAVNPESWDLWTPFAQFQPVDNWHPSFAPETLALALHEFVVMSEGGMPWVGSAGADGGAAPAHMRAIKTVFDEVRKYEAYHGGRGLPDAALVASMNTRDFWAKEDPVRYFRSLYGAFELLSETHRVFDLLFDEDVAAEALSEYRLLVLSNVACIGRKCAAAIDEFVRRGGVLIATGQTGLFDEDARRLPDFGLECLGVTHTGKRTDGYWLGAPGEERVRDAAGELFYADAELEGIKVHGDEVEVWATAAMTAVGGDYVRLPDDDTGAPCITRHAFGDGQAVYCAFDLGKAFLSRPQSSLRELFRLLSHLAPPRVLFDGPRCVEITAFTREDGAKLLLHMVNYPYMTNRPAGSPRIKPRVDEVVPVHGATVTVLDRKFTRATWIPDGNSLAVDERSGGTLVELPPIGPYNILVLE